MNCNPALRRIRKSIPKLSTHLTTQFGMNIEAPMDGIRYRRGCWFSAVRSTAPRNYSSAREYLSFLPLRCRLHRAR